MLSTTLRLFGGRSGRTVLTVTGISLSILMMGFLLALYRGVENGSVAYLRATDADVWVVQSHTTNILRGFSLLTAAHAGLIREVDDVTAVSPLLFRLSSIATPRGLATAYLAGYDPSAPSGGPSSLLEGRTVEGTGEIVLDAAFASRWGLSTGHTVQVQDVEFLVVGLSEATNMVVIQYAFASIDDVRRLYGISDLVSVFAVRARPDTDVPSLVKILQEDIPGVTVYAGEEFIANNLQEMESGFLPVLLVLAVVGSCALGAIVSLLLTIDVLERRTDLAVLKTLGAPTGYLPAAVALRALVVSAVSSVIAAALSFPVTTAIQRAAPEVAVHLDVADAVALTCGLLLVSAAGIVFPLRRLRTIFPTEAFA